MKDLDKREWALGELLADPEKLFVLWAVRGQFCMTANDFKNHYGSEFPIYEIVDALTRDGFLQQKGDGLVLAERGKHALEFFQRVEVTQRRVSERDETVRSDEPAGERANTASSAAQRERPLESKVSENAAMVEKLEAEFQHLKSVIETSHKHIVTWRNLIPIQVALISLLLASFAFFYKTVLPHEIENAVQGSTALDAKFNSVNAKINSIDTEIKGLNVKVGEVMNTIVGALKNNTSASRDVLAKTLPESRKLLAAARGLKIPFRNDDYEAIAQPLFNHLATSKPPLKQEVWNTVIDLANTRTITDTVLYPVSETEIAERKASNNYFEGTIDLSSRPVWKDTVFRNCQLALSKRNTKILLSNVRFVQCTFQMEENDQNQRFLKSLLTAPGPTISILSPISSTRIYVVPVLPNRGVRVVAG